MENQVFIFLIFILNGFLIGILFDIFRIFRKSFKTSDLFTNIQDILFWILVGLTLLYSIFKFNNGELRLYIFLGVLLGNFLYMLIFSNLFIKISVNIINIIKKAIKIIIIIPVKYVFALFKKIFFNPFRMILTKIVKFLNNILTFFKSKCKNLKLKNTKHKNKKDFA